MLRSNCGASPNVRRRMRPNWKTPCSVLATIMVELTPVKWETHAVHFIYFFSFHSFANSILNDDIKRCQVTRPDGVFTGRQRGSPGLSGSEPLDVNGGDYVGGVPVRTAPQAGGVYPSGRFHRVDHKHHPIIRLDLYLCHSFHGEFNHALR